MKFKKFATFSIFLLALGLFAGCHDRSSDNYRYGRGYGTYRDGNGSYREGYRDGRATERRREAWRDRWDDARRDDWRRRW